MVTISFSKSELYLFCKELNNFQRRQVGAWGDGLGVQDGNAVKLGCDDDCTAIKI